LNQIKNFLVGLIFFVCGVSFTNAQSIFQTEYESSEGYTVGVLNPQLNWATGELATEDNSVTPYSGIQFIWLPTNFQNDGNELSRPVDSLFADAVVYVDFYLSPNAASSFEELPEISDYPIAALTGLVDTGDGFGECVFVHGNGSGDGVWQSTSSYIELGGAAISEQLWYVFKLDYASNLYDFFLNGTLIAENVPFIDSNVTQLDQIGTKADGEEDMYFDRLTVSYDRPVELDHGSETISMNEMEMMSQVVHENGAHRLVQEISSAVVDASIDLYVDCEIGKDNYNGLSAIPGNPTVACGPKASITVAIDAAGDSDNILLQSGTYNESILNLNGRNLTLHLNGHVIID
jgi:hypothetical protein